MAKGKVLKTIIDISGEISPTLGKTIDAVTSKLDGMNVKALAVGASVAAIAGAAAVGFGKATKYLADLGNEYDKAADQMAASTGLVGEELAALESVMQGVYGNNFGETFEEAAAGVSEMYKQTGLLGDELQVTTEAAFALCDTFGYDITETARAAKAMITNFGVSGEEAMGLIAAGAQNGLDYSGELIDSINEYSVQFSKLGFTADEMFQIFQEGADSGAWNLDKVGDAVKEFSIRSIDGSKTTTHAFEALGLNAEEMMATFAAGGDDASIAFQGVVAALMSVDDQVARDAIGVELFGTQWEDLGIEAVAALADISVNAYDTGDALSKINAVKYDNLDDAMQGIKRQIEVTLLPAAQEVQQAFMDVAPKIEELLVKAEPVFTKIAGAVGPTVTAVIDFAENGIAFLSDNIDTLVPIVAGLTAAFAAYKAITAAVAIAEGIKTAVMATGVTTVTAASVATWALNGALAVLTSPITLVVAAIAALVAGGVALYKNWDTVKVKAAEIWDKVTSIFTKAKDTVSKVFSALGQAMLSPFQSVIDIVGTLSSKIGGVLEKIGLVKSSGSSIPAFAAGGFTDGISIAGEAGTEAVISFDPAYRSQNLSYWAQAGRMLGANVSDFTLSGSGGGSSINLGGVTFAPNITITGRADKQSIMEAIEAEYPEFIDFLEDYLAKRGDPCYA